MTISLYQAAVPPVLQVLNSLLNILGKASAHCQARKIEPSVLLGSRLFPDMFPLVRQVQIATDQAKGMAARLAGIEVPSYPDDEANFEGLQVRIASTIAFIKSINKEQIDGTEDKDIHFKIGGMELKFKGQQYLLHFVFPNFYFHATTTYNILRHNGVELSKRDFLGEV